MAKKVNTKLLGVFILGAFFLSGAAIVLFGSGDWFKPISRFVVYFPESVQGLKVGADVQSHGVDIGSVVDIQAIYVPDRDNIIIPVYIEIDRTRIRNLLPAKKTISEQQENIIKLGLRAKLITESFVTGQRAVALSFNPETPERLVGLDKSLPEIPSLASSIERLSNKLENLPLAQIADKLDRILSVLSEAIVAPEFTNGLNSFGSTMVEVKTLTEKLNADLPDILKEVRLKVAGFKSEEISKNAEASLATLDKAIQNIQAQTTPLGRNANTALIEVATAARELRQLAELLQRQPEALLKGKK
jgi:paraquat-inducible protein B